MDHEAFVGVHPSSHGPKVRMLRERHVCPQRVLATGIGSLLHGATAGLVVKVVLDQSPCNRHLVNRLRIYIGSERRIGADHSKTFKVRFRLVHRMTEGEVYVVVNHTLNIYSP